MEFYLTFILANMWQKLIFALLRPFIPHFYIIWINDHHLMASSLVPLAVMFIWWLHTRWIMLPIPWSPVLLHLMMIDPLRCVLWLSFERLCSSLHCLHPADSAWDYSKIKKTALQTVLSGFPVSGYLKINPVIFYIFLLICKIPWKDQKKQ